MYIPAIPTDNLYKFVALSGIALVLVSLIYPEQAIRDLEVRIIDSETQTRVLLAQADRLEKDLDILEKTPDFEDQKLELIKQKNDEIRINSLKSTGENQKIALYTAHVEKVDNYATFLLWIGCAMSILGFFFWYKRVQKPADLAAARESQEAHT